MLLQGFLAPLFIYLLIDSLAVLFITRDYSKISDDDGFILTIKRLAILQLCAASVGITGVAASFGFFN